MKSMCFYPARTFPCDVNTLGFAHPAATERSEQQRAVQIKDRLGTDMLDSPLAIGTKPIKAKRILFRINFP